MRERNVGSAVFRLERLDKVDSTNNYLKLRAAEGAPHGLAVVAEEQTGGRGRFGRSFHSPRGKGLYLSVLLRPDFPALQAAGLTPWAAVAVCRALEEVTGLNPEIKWINDILLEGKKVCGILTEADITPDGRLNYVILGIGLNLTHEEGDFPSDVAPIATSLTRHLPSPPDREAVLSALLTELETMWKDFPEQGEDYLEAYRARCSTVGQEILITVGSEEKTGFALGVNEDFSLRVRYESGECQNLDSGMVSARRKGLTQEKKRGYNEEKDPQGDDVL